MQAVPQHNIGLLHCVDVLRGGLVGVWVAARANQGDHLGIWCDVLGSVGKVARSGEDGQLFVCAVAAISAAGIGIGVIAACSQAA